MLLLSPRSQSSNVVLLPLPMLNLDKSGNSADEIAPFSDVKENEYSCDNVADIQVVRMKTGLILICFFNDGLPRQLLGVNGTTIDK